MDETGILKESVLKQLQTIPSIGKACAIDLWDLGIRSISDLDGADPAMLYAKLNTLRGVRQDPCMLYTLRCAIYFASEENHNPQKLKWWYWKDNTYNE